MSRWDDRSTNLYDYGRPRQADGIKAKSKRGAIGEKWWSQRFVDALSSLERDGRLARGKRYARQGQVLELHIHSGLVDARVQGSEPEPYRVEIELTALTEAQWRAVEAELAAHAIYAAKLLAGELPTDIDDAFAAVGQSLLPAGAGDLVFRCSCPDWSNPCKHIAACLFLLAEDFDNDPFLILEWRGRPKDTLLDNLRALRGTAASAKRTSAPTLPRIVPEPVATVLDEHLDDFYSARGELADIQIRPVATETPDAVLRRLADSGIDVRGERLETVLSPAYAILTQVAVALAYEDEET